MYPVAFLFSSVIQNAFILLLLHTAGHQTVRQNPGPRYPEEPLLPLLHRHILPLFHDALISRSDDLVHVDEFFDAVGTPAHDSGHGKHRGVELQGDVQHAVDEAAVEIHVGADAFVDFPLLADDDRSQALHVGVETKFFLAAFFGSQAVDEGFENIGTGVGRWSRRRDPFRRSDLDDRKASRFKRALK